MAVLELVIKGVDQASGSLKAVGRESDGLGGKLKLLAAAATGVVAGFVSFKTITSAIDKTKELGSAVSKMTRETGLSSEAASRLLFAFRRFGVDADSASNMLGLFAKRLKGISDEEDTLADKSQDTADQIASLNRKMGELNTDLQQAKTPEEFQKISNRIADTQAKLEDLQRSPAAKGVVALLADMGISATDAGGNLREMGDLIPEIADRFKAMPDGVEKTALAMQLFGRSGKDMIPLLNQGSDGMKVLAEQADKLGLTLSADNLQKIKDYGKAQFNLGEAIGGLKLVIGLELMPVLTDLATWLTDHQPQIREVLIDLIEIAKEKIDKLVEVMGDLVDKAKELKPQFDAMREAATKLNEAIERLPGPVKDLGAIALVTAAGVGALGAIGLPVIGIMKGLGLAIALVGGLVAALSILLIAFITPVTIASGVLYLLGVRFGDVTNAIGVVIGAIGELIKWVAGASAAFTRDFIQPLGVVSGALATAASWITNVLIGAIGSLIGWLPGVAAGLWANFTQPLGAVSGALSDASRWIWNVISDIGNLLAKIPGLGGLSTPFQQARDWVKVLWEWIGKLIDRIKDIDLMPSLGGIPSPGGIFNKIIPGRQWGGPVSAGSPYIVGEKGPEWFIPKVAGTILPNLQALTRAFNIAAPELPRLAPAMAAPSAQGGNTYMFNITVPPDGEAPLAARERQAEQWLNSIRARLRAEGI